MDEEVLEDVAVVDGERIDDWEQHLDKLPERPRTFIEHKCRRLFAVDLNGCKGHDQYVYVLPNGLCVSAPPHGSHPPAWLQADCCGCWECSWDRPTMG